MTLNKNRLVHGLVVVAFLLAGPVVAQLPTQPQDTTNAIVGGEVLGVRLGMSSGAGNLYGDKPKTSDAKL